jgi:hypothetical protein
VIERSRNNTGLSFRIQAAKSKKSPKKMEKFGRVVDNRHPVNERRLNLDDNPRLDDPHQKFTRIENLE